MAPKKNLAGVTFCLLMMVLMAPLRSIATGAPTRFFLTSFKYNTTCLNDTVKFTITDDIRGIDSVKWYFVSPPLLPEDSSKLIRGAYHIYRTPGTYTVTLKTYRNGIEDITTSNITIVAPRGVDLGPDLTLCENSTTTITAPNIPGATYTWYYLQDTVPGTNTFLVSQMATYHVAINGCMEPDSVNVFYSPIPKINLGPDRTLCTGEMLTLDATAQNATYVWSTGETTPTIVARGPGGPYWVRATVAGCGVYTSQVTINFRGPAYPFSLGPDTLLCAGESVILNAARPEATRYVWNTGARTPSINVNRAGDYSVFVTINGICDVVDTIGVRYSRLQKINLGNDTTLCYPNFLVLNADHGTGSYLWQDGSDQATYHVDSSGYYYVRVQIGRCVESDTIRVDFQDSLRVILGLDTTLCIGETLTLIPRGAGSNYKWQDSTSTPTYLVTQPGIYAIVARNVCNRATASIEVRYQDCNCTLFFPTAFTPNGDGVNDVFRPKYRCLIAKYKLSIYNRWGEFMFYTTNPGVAWNGKNNGETAPAGTYVWIVEYVDELKNKYYRKQGTVTLIR